jgi:hypothetical protein
MCHSSQNYYLDDLTKQPNYVSKFRWYKVPLPLGEILFEDTIYQYGSVVFFYREETGNFYLMPYKPKRERDAQGRPNVVHPVLPKGFKKTPYLNKKTEIKIIHDIVLPEELTLEHLRNGGVIFDTTHDYSFLLALKSRQDQCDIVNSVWGLGLDVADYNTPISSYSTEQNPESASV